MHDLEGVAIFWDYENCPVSSSTSGYSIVDNIRLLTQPYGSIKSFRAYLEISDQAQKSLALRSELQSSGVSLVDCPHNGRKDVADKMIIVDMFAHAIDTPAPSTVVLITGDRDFAYAISILRLRRYRVVLVTLSNAHASLTAQASVCLDWTIHVLSPTEASVKASKHSKQTSSSSVQEKSRSSGMLNPRIEWMEARRSEEAGFLQMIPDPTENRLAPVLSPKGNSTSSSSQGVKERHTESTNSTSDRPFAKANSIVSPALELTSARKSSTSTGIPTKTGPLNENASFRNQPIAFVVSNREQPVDTSNTFDDEPLTPNHADNHKELFIQPLLNQSVPPNPSLEADPRSASSSVLFLPSILTGSSSRTRTFTPAKVVLEPPPTIEPNPVAICGPRPNNGENTLSPVVKEATSPKSCLSNTFTSTPLQRLPDIVSPSQPTVALNYSSAHPMARHTSYDYKTLYSAYTFLTSPRPGAVVSQSISRNDSVLPVQPIPTYNNLVSPLLSPSSVHSSLPLPFGSPSSRGSPFSRDRTTDGDSEVAFDSSSLHPATVAESDSITGGFVPGLKSESLPTKIVSPVSQTGSLPISSPSKTSETVPTPNNSPSAGSDSGSAAVPPMPTAIVIPEIFRILVECLQAHLSKGNPRPLRGVVSLQISNDGSTYAKAGVTNFGQYIALAEERGIIELGGTEAWISLRPDWHHASPSAAAEVVNGLHSSIVKGISLLTVKLSTVELDQLQTSISTPSTPFQLPSTLSSPAILSDVLKHSGGDLASPISTTVSAPNTPSLALAAVEEPFIQSRASSAPPVPLSSTDTFLLPPISSIPVLSAPQTSASEASPSPSNSLHEDKCTNDDSQPVGTASLALPTIESQLAPFATKSTDSGVHMDPPAETLPLPDISIDSHPPILKSPSESLAAPSSPVSSPSNVGESDADANFVNTPAPVETIPLPNVILQPQQSASTTILPSVPQTEETVSSSSATFSAVAKSVTGSSPVSPTPPVTQPQPATPVIPEIFLILIQCLQAHKSRGTERPLRSIISLEVHKNGSTYKKAGVERFAQYATLAENKGIIELGGTGGNAWISLKPDWNNASSFQALAPATVPDMFKILVQCLQVQRSTGTYCPTRSVVALQVNKNGTTYKNAGVTKFKHYAALAEKAGIVELGGEMNDAWIRLKPQWYDAVVS